MKFQPGEPVWAISDGRYDAEPGKYAGTIVRFFGYAFDVPGQQEIYVVEIPTLGGQNWTVNEMYLRPRQADPKDPPGLTDQNPDQPTTWERCAWQPGEVTKKKGTIWVPPEFA